MGQVPPNAFARSGPPSALQLAAGALHIDVGFEWISTETVTSTQRLSRFAGLWCVPTSPYRSMDGALLAIRCACGQVSTAGRLVCAGVCNVTPIRSVELAVADLRRLAVPALNRWAASDAWR